MADIFISYSKESPAPTRRLAEVLQSRGYRVWWDIGILSGSAFAAEIEKQLKACKAVVVIWTEASVQSTWVLNEAEYGRKHDKLISTHAIDYDGGPPLPFQHLHCVPSADIVEIEKALTTLHVYPVVERERSEQVFDPNLLRGHSEAAAIATVCLELGHQFLTEGRSSEVNFPTSSLFWEKVEFAFQAFRAGRSHLSDIEASYPKLAAFLMWGMAITYQAADDEIHDDEVGKLTSEGRRLWPSSVPPELPLEKLVAVHDFNYALESWEAESIRQRASGSDVLHKFSRISWDKFREDPSVRERYFFQPDILREN